MAPVTARDICEAAAFEFNIFDAGSPIPGDEAVFILGKLNRLLDSWNAKQAAVYGDFFSLFTLTPNLQPHTIGIAANAPTFSVASSRPQTIDGANIVTGSGTSQVRYELDLVDEDWWKSQSVRNVTSPIPSALYYANDWPNGSIYLWPVPSTAYTLELMFRLVLAQLALTDTFTLPPGYWDAITLTLAESISTPYEKQVPPDFALRARQARALVFDANDETPRISTRDAGMPGGGGPTGNYLTGWYR